MILSYGRGRRSRSELKDFIYNHVLEDIIPAGIRVTEVLSSVEGNRVFVRVQGFDSKTPSHMAIARTARNKGWPQPISVKEKDIPGDAVLWSDFP